MKVAKVNVDTNSRVARFHRLAADQGVLVAGIEPGSFVYFVHSFHAVASEPGVVRASVQHGENTVTAAVARDNVLATQFHPEKSQAAGLALLRGFLIH